MAADSHVPATLDHILSGVRAQLDVELRAYADHVARTAAEERDDAIEQMSAEVRRQASEDVERAQRTAESRLAELAAERDRLRAELGALQRQLHDLEMRELERREREEREEEARLAAGRVRTHLAPGIRSIDEAEALSDVLERLAEAALVHCDRVALLRLTDDRLPVWRGLGFDGWSGTGEVLTIDAAGIAGTAARERRVTTSTDEHALPLPRFARLPAPSGAAAFPITVSGSVVMVLYADVATERQPESTWIADLEVLARHAARVLETVTIQQVIGLHSAGVARPWQSVPSAPVGLTPDPSAPRDRS